MLLTAIVGQAAFTSANTISEHYWNTFYNAGYLRAQVNHYLEAHPHLCPLTKRWTVVSPDRWGDFGGIWKLVMRLETVVG